MPALNFFKATDNQMERALAAFMALAATFENPDERGRVADLASMIATATKSDMAVVTNIYNTIVADMEKIANGDLN